MRLLAGFLGLICGRDKIQKIQEHGVSSCNWTSLTLFSSLDPDLVTQDFTAADIFAYFQTKYIS